MNRIGGGSLPMLLSVAAMAMFAATGCTSCPDRTVGEAIEGQYVVGYYPRLGESDIPLGYLSLVDGHYSFVPLENADMPEEIVNSLIFLQHPKGSYVIEYPDSVVQDTLLKNLEDDSMLSVIFDADNTDEELDSSFIIKSYKDTRYLCLLRGEARLKLGIGQLWYACKPWN